MPASFLKRHRTICNVLEEIRDKVIDSDATMAEAREIDKLVDEAKDYAQRMSAKLVEYKNLQRPSVDGDDEDFPG